MTSTDRPFENKTAAPDEGDLADLVDDAVKALSISGPFGQDDELRQAVDSLKRIEAERAEV